MKMLWANRGGGVCVFLGTSRLGGLGVSSHAATHVSACQEAPGFVSLIESKVRDNAAAQGYLPARQRNKSRHKTT